MLSSKDLCSKLLDCRIVLLEAFKSTYSYEEMLQGARGDSLPLQLPDSSDIQKLYHQL